MPRTAIILAGGLGTRLRPLTFAIPKPALPVGPLPLVGHQLMWFGGAGVERAVLAAGYLVDKLQQELLPCPWPLEIDVLAEPEPLGTAGAIAWAWRQSGCSGPVFASNGDIICTGDLAAMAAAHASAGADATILVRRVADVSQFGVVLCDDQGRVEAFMEKPDRDPTGRNLVNAGIYILEPALLELVPEGRACSIEREIFPQALKKGMRLQAFRIGSGDYWRDVGRIADYLQANMDCLRGEVPWAGPGVAAQAELAATASVHWPAWIGEGAVIENGAAVGPDAVVGPGARLGRLAQVSRAVVLGGAQVRECAKIHNAVVLPDGQTVPAGP